MEMDDRKIKILRAIINDYINTAEPVGSRTIAKKYDLGISSATIRNEMADLEDMGYLEQLHTSSGRKPSDKGYRLYVDKLMKIAELSPEEESLIKNRLLDVALYEVDQVLKQASQLLSELTNLTSMVKTPSVKNSYLKSIQLLEVDNNNILAVVITDSGIIKNTLIRIKEPISKDILLKLNNLLNLRLKNLTVKEINLKVINTIKQDLNDHQEIFDAIIPVLYESLSTVDKPDTILEGTTNIFNYPEFYDIEKAKEFLSLLNDKDVLDTLLDNDSNISIVIGNENNVEGARECSIVTATYKLSGRPIGTIGVIGPTRIPYSKVIPVLANIAKEINDNLSHNYYDDR